VQGHEAQWNKAKGGKTDKKGSQVIVRSPEPDIRTFKKDGGEFPMAVSEPAGAGGRLALRKSPYTRSEGDLMEFLMAIIPSLRQAVFDSL
jgi:hypothetical protein